MEEQKKEIGKNKKLDSDKRQAKKMYSKTTKQTLQMN